MKTPAAVITGLSLIFASAVLGWFFLQSRQETQIVKVVGYASEEFDSNVVKWTVSLSETISLSGIQQGYEKMAGRLTEFRSIWDQTGIRSEEFRIFPINVNREYGQSGHIGYTLTQRIYIVSAETEKIEQLAINPETFVKKGVTFEQSEMEFFNTELDSIKKQLLGKATQNARERAEEIVSTTDLKVDKLISARSGVFQITEPYSTEVAGYGIHNTSSSRKSIKVTLSADFSLR